MINTITRYILQPLCTIYITSASQTNELIFNRPQFHLKVVKFDPNDNGVDRRLLLLLTKRSLVGNLTSSSC